MTANLSIVIALKKKSCSILQLLRKTTLPCSIQATWGYLGTSVTYLNFPLYI